MALHYHLVDVFTDRLFGGNQLAVFLGGQDVPEDLMQPIARELNLSETTFVLPPEAPEADFRVRIFTPAAELPMAGHPTVGTAFVLAREGRIPVRAGTSVVHLEEGVGVLPVEIRHRGDRPTGATMDQPGPRFGPVFEDREALAATLGLELRDLDPESPAEVVSCGVPFLFAPLRSLDAVRRARPRLDLWAEHLEPFAAAQVYLFCRHVQLPGSDVHGRMFAPTLGVLEDPATGSANGPLGCYLVRHGLAGGGDPLRLVSEQGFEMGRPSLLEIEIHGGPHEIRRVRVGGDCVHVGRGELELA
ncbi:MAG: PhzF family phenazine biosynthesis protein [Acidobacteria bacterium]|nr:PhzF family phenazine biosynthesis protein [Acidobacteriota bacterium]